HRNLSSLSNGWQFSAVDSRNGRWTGLRSKQGQQLRQSMVPGLFNNRLVRRWQNVVPSILERERNSTSSIRSKHRHPDAAKKVWHTRSDSRDVDGEAEDSVL